MQAAREGDWYVPAAWEAEPSVVAGMSRGEFERLAAQIRWFSSLPLEARLRQTMRDRELQVLFGRLKVDTDTERPHGS